MPPRRRLTRAQGTGLCPIPDLVLSPQAPPPGGQQNASHPPPPLPFQPPYVGGHAVPVGGSQYHVAGLGMNAPPFYAQPYGVPPYPPFHRPDLAYASIGNAQLQPWGYNHYPIGPVPRPVAQSDNTRTNSASPEDEAQSHAAVVPDVEAGEVDARAEGRGVDKDNEGAVRQGKTYPNKQVSDGGMSFSTGGMLTTDIQKFGSFLLRSPTTR